MEVMIYRTCRYHNTYKYCLRQTDNKKFVDFYWFNTMKQCKEHAQKMGYTLVDRPDLLAKWRKIKYVRY